MQIASTVRQQSSECHKHSANKCKASSEPLNPPKQRRVTSVIDRSSFSDTEVPPTVPSSEILDREDLHQALLKWHCSSPPEIPLFPASPAKWSHFSCPPMVNQPPTGALPPSPSQPLSSLLNDASAVQPSTGVPTLDMQGETPSDYVPTHPQSPVMSQSTLGPAWFIVPDLWDMHQEGCACVLHHAAEDSQEPKPILGIEIKWVEDLFLGVHSLLLSLPAYRFGHSISPTYWTRAWARHFCPSL